MKILKPGNIPTKKFICPDCGCEFEADKLEYKSIGKEEAQMGLAKYKCKCPCCGLVVYAD